MNEQSELAVKPESPKTHEPLKCLLLFSVVVICGRLVVVVVGGGREYSLPLQQCQPQSP